MRIRATVAAVTGALALSAFVAPAAHAAGSTTLDVTFSNMKVNGGKAVVVPATGSVKFSVTYTVTHAATLKSSDFSTIPVIYRGSSIESSQYGVAPDDLGTCTDTSTTVESCKATLSASRADLVNSIAGAWQAGGVAFDKDDNPTFGNGLGKVLVQRLSKLTVNATPEPVKKGKTITVTGSLTRANWDAGKYSGYAGQKVKLQFRKKGSSTYTTLKTITTSSTGTLKTTTKATVDGYFRYSFAGTTTTPAVSATGDFVDVR
ncbi:hypothetical protein [Streptomyces gilvus]|uniref:hypothetical protein n=1 Tax=Streptomyces gilvus TaxID=2920937 RepID=UPI001F0F532B|nr:hypothetical protein [Streptomyces sp. CME 23]MCH5675889.1 hypothetical protein [Streptomyces sp. CME 23]